MYGCSVAVGIALALWASARSLSRAVVEVTDGHGLRQKMVVEELAVEIRRLLRDVLELLFACHGRYRFRLGHDRATKRLETAMRMRGLEPPRGSEASGDTWRNVLFMRIQSPTVTLFHPVRAGFTD
jgi:hypothetical protein